MITAADVQKKVATINGRLDKDSIVYRGFEAGLSEYGWRAVGYWSTGAGASGTILEKGVGEYAITIGAFVDVGIPSELLHHTDLEELPPAAVEQVDAALDDVMRVMNRMDDVFLAKEVE